MRLLDVGYGIIAIAASPLWLTRLIRTGKHRTDWRGRFGGVQPIPREGSRPRILIHAVSVGEVNAIRLLIDTLMREPARDGGDPPEVVLAVTTDTGFAHARSLFGKRLAVVRYPFDFSPAVERFLDMVQPDIAVLIELELWPNFVASCERRNIPVCIVNGRLTERSHRRYRMVRPLLRRTFARLTFVAAQNEMYAERFRDLGTPADRVRVTGTMKWDTSEIADDVEGADELARELGIERAQPIIVAGSTAPGEHELLHRATMPLPGAQLLCAPRKPEWFEEAAKALPGCVRRSESAGGESQRADRFLLDTIGELRKAYSLADVVVVGRTFTDLGGSDMMEPVALGKPVVVGPYVSNFADTVEALLKADGLIQTDAQGLPAVLKELLEDRDRRRQLAENGRAVIRAHQGATARHAELIRHLLQEAAVSTGDSC